MIDIKGKLGIYKGSWCSVPVRAGIYGVPG